MKRLTITIALMLVVALAMPAFGASFSDVPSDHWSYNAINKLVAAGIVEGYPDGEFKGEQSMTRYEMAVMVSRALDNIVDEMEAMGQGLTTGQAEDVTAIVKSLMEKNTNETLSDAQAEEVADIVDALTFELRSELKVLGADVDALGKDMDELEAKVNALETDMPKDNIEFSGKVTAVFQAGSYGDDPTATAEALADGDALDVDLPRVDPNGVYSNSGGDYDDFPAEQAFYQEFDFIVNAEVSGINLDFVVDTITNGFTDYEGYRYDDYDYVLGDQGDDDKDIMMDTGRLDISKDNWMLKIGDMDDYDVDENAYFFDVEDAEGVEFTGPVYGLDLKAFAIGLDEGDEDEYYGAAATKDFGKTQVTGKVYQGSIDSKTSYNNGDPAYGERVTDVAVAVQSALTDALTVNGEAVYNELDEAGTDDSLFQIGADYKLSDIWSFRGSYQTVGDEFNGGADYYTGVESDLEEDYDFDKYTLGTSYVVNDNNSLDFDVMMVEYAGDDAFSDKFAADNSLDRKTDEDKMEYTVGWNNVYGKFTNHFRVSYIENDYYTDVIDDDATVVELGTEFPWTEKTTVSASIVNKQADLYDNEGIWDKDMQYTYLTAGLDHKLTENISWLTDVMYITGDVDQLNEHEDNDNIINNNYDYSNSNNADIDGSFITTSLSISF
ncbi:S-layer homology domain-containing protein [Halanaerobium congolense]|jgi:polyhydroxyalkanoate synthesis regulator phasin|uniref:S-layer homology domain-containing protein n=1 Tax=Halanaerobium congolense TaxID=54121 RepID=A0A1H9ZBS0_9FIRM|nr:S-layer homology domain-containing protein [Halanaerobium congolense]PTX15786.1 S-layer family protein [Halanaerobium congolense]SDF22091.1 S-layer homology domain-containing protein [Halanaerobium congolense]SDH27201.1 S-layer homology domain-containing protein [Halanaerobium congolense]SES79023.1 S-layer homology domain-containing protein [Halanaerobium congolense]SFP10645.1 S-layer homology domain-containing protein [Halanaerobium congolense]